MDFSQRQKTFTTYRPFTKYLKEMGPRICWWKRYCCKNII